MLMGCGKKPNKWVGRSIEADRAREAAKSAENAATLAARWALFRADYAAFLAGGMTPEEAEIMARLAALKAGRSISS